MHFLALQFYLYNYTLLTGKIKVKPLLSGPYIMWTPIGQQFKFHFSFHCKKYLYSQTPLKWMWHLKLDVYNHFYQLLQTCIKWTLQKMHDFFVHVLTDWSLKFSNKVSCHRNTIFCDSILFLQNLLFLFDVVNFT